MEDGVRGALEQIERRVFGGSPVDVVVVGVLKREVARFAPDVDAEEEEVVHRVDDVRGHGQVQIGAVNEELGRLRRALEAKRDLDGLPIPGAVFGGGVAVVDADDGHGVEEDTSGASGSSTHAPGARRRGSGHGFCWKKRSAPVAGGGAGRCGGIEDGGAGSTGDGWGLEKGKIGSTALKDPEIWKIPPKDRGHVKYHRKVRIWTEKSTPLK